jgi:predicted TIM-barrel fold metal-dependent hydrolase
MYPEKTFLESRRATLRGLFTLPLFQLAACAPLNYSREKEIEGEIPPKLQQILKPAKITKNNNLDFIIDVHAHFFNARDVPVKGYLAGPVAHSRGGIIGEFLKEIAGIADWISGVAPSAVDEYNELVKLAGDSQSPESKPQRQIDSLSAKRIEYINNISVLFYQKALENRKIVELYNNIKNQSHERLSSKSIRPRSLNEFSLSEAMERNHNPLMDEEDALYREENPPPYADGVLAFVGYMLSYRWMNLLAYQHAYSSGDAAFGVHQVFGALVDFDHWLEPLPRTAHEDQIKLHQLISQLSGGYMRPLVAYNPWSDVRDNGETLKRTLDALDNRGFVGVKIYPPNGFRPYGNTLPPKLPDTPGMPSGMELDRVLLKLWKECYKRNVPVMAHTGHSMGSDEAHIEAAGPIGWQALIDARGSEEPPIVNLGHFGGFGKGPDSENWTRDLAKMMQTKKGSRLYGDLGYWDELRCLNAAKSCSAKENLEELLKDIEVLKERLMYGSDWLMLSQEPRWDRYPFDILAALPKNFDKKAVFGGNAKRCFEALQKLS